MSDSCCQTHSPAPGAFGIENPRGLDALAFDGETGEAVLIMVEPRAWDGTEERIFQLQEKVNAYLSFALDGEMTDAFRTSPASPSASNSTAPSRPTRRSSNSSPPSANTSRYRT